QVTGRADESGLPGRGIAPAAVRLDDGSKLERRNGSDGRVAMALTLPEGGTIELACTPGAATLSRDGRQVVSQTSTPDGRPAAVEIAGRTRLRPVYDPRGRLEGLDIDEIAPETPTAESLRLIYDVQGRLTEIRDHRGAASSRVAIRYDEAGRYAGWD